jgi:hypothetical protein
MPRIKPANGQLSLLPGVPPVQYCKACGRLLVGEASRKRGLGRTCARRVRHKLREVVYCGCCGRRLDVNECCDSCGMGYVFGPVKHRRLWVKPGRKGPATFPKREES